VRKPDWFWRPVFIAAVPILFAMWLIESLVPRAVRAAWQMGRGEWANFRMSIYRAWKGWT
jgi:hypothetical protein